MKAFIMAGGFGKRLRPLTNRIPKPLIKAAGKPIIWWQIKWLESHGISDFVLLGGYRHQQIVSYIRSIGYSKNFEISVENRPLGTGGAVLNAAAFVEDEEKFLIVNGDNVTDLNPMRMSLEGNVCNISMVPYRSTKGIIAYRGDKVVRFEEKPLIKGYWYNAGVTLASPMLLRYLKKECSLEHDAFPRMAKAGRLSCTKYGSAYFNAVDSFKDLEEIDRDLKSGKVRF